MRLPPGDEITSVRQRRRNTRFSAAHASWCCQTPARIIAANAVSKAANNNQGAKNAIDAMRLEARSPIEEVMMVTRCMCIDGLNC